MNDKLRKSLQSAVGCLPHPVFEEIASKPIQKMEEMDYMTRQETVKPIWGKSAGWARLTFACLGLFVCLAAGGRWYEQNLRVYSVIDLDVNPSFEIKANQKEKVLSFKGYNEEAKALLAGTDYRNMELGDAVESLILSMREENYINEGQKTVLLTVDSRDTAAGAELARRLSGRIRDTLAPSNLSPMVVRQAKKDESGKTGKEIRSEASQWSVSPGKMRLIHTVMRFDSEYTEGELASMPVEQLMEILKKYENELDKEIELDGDWDEEFKESQDSRSQESDREEEDRERESDREDEEQEREDDREEEDREREDDREEEDREREDTQKKEDREREDDREKEDREREDDREEERKVDDRDREEEREKTEREDDPEEQDQEQEDGLGEENRGETGVREQEDDESEESETYIADNEIEDAVSEGPGSEQAAHGGGDSDDSDDSDGGDPDDRERSGHENSEDDDGQDHDTEHRDSGDDDDDSEE